MSLKSILVAGAVALASFSFVIDDAEAKKRLGGAKSSGMQRDSSPASPQSPAAAPAGQPGSAAAAPAQRAPGAAPAAAPSGMSKWMGPIAGLLAGTALGALLMSSGMGGMIGMLLMALLVGGIIFFVFRMLRNKGSNASSGPTAAYAGAGGAAGDANNGGTYNEPPRPAPAAFTPAPAERTSTGRIVAPAIGGALTGNINADTVAAVEAAPVKERIPEGFDEAGFMRDAKASFIKLQAANDNRDVSVLRDFLTPALYSELAPDIMARDASPQRVDVVRLDANVLEVVSENAHWIASVRFSGEIREEEGAAAEPFNEVWHLRKPFGGKWLVAGIQQVA
jgi:predicted lipid-binding transport protein (Tim44 family)